MFFLFLIITYAPKETESIQTLECGFGDLLPNKYSISVEEAEERECCINLPCNHTENGGCWAGLTPPLYSAPRAQTLNREQCYQLQSELIWPHVVSDKTSKLRSPDSMPEHEWWRISLSQDEYSWVYDEVQSAFQRTYQQELIFTVDLDIFFIDDFDERWTNDETYKTSYPGAGYWIHEDCSNLRLCYSETGYSADQFSGNGLAFVFPLMLPGPDFRDGNPTMPAALELYNTTVGHPKPKDRRWMREGLHRYNLGEIIFFNAFRFHSGHVPPENFVDWEMNNRGTRAEAIGFAAELKDGPWVLFRMCKGSTDDGVKEKILDKQEL